MAHKLMTREKKQADRMEFLETRMAYLARMRAEGVSIEEMIYACNLSDAGQVQLLLMTWDEAEGKSEDAASGD